MKKIIPLTLLAAVSVNAAAQNVQDALRFSENNYYGTARSISMGNAFTALGGDLGSINLNPAGSAVNSFSQVTFTPNVSIVSTTSDYNAMPSQSTAYGSTLNNSSARFTLPNVGFTLNFDTNARRGVKRVTFGFIANATANYLDDMAAGGRNSHLLCRFIGFDDERRELQPPERGKRILQQCQCSMESGNRLAVRNGVHLWLCE